MVLVFKYIFMSMVSITMLPLSYLLTPIIVPFANSDGWFPSCLSWFQTPDNSLDGDEGWKTEHFLFISNTYIRRVLWLWRNPACSFDSEVLGIVIPEGYSYEVYGDELTSNQPLHAGFVLRKIRLKGELKSFQLYIIKDYNFLGHRCLRMNFGWKLWGDMSSGIEKQFVCSVNPWMKIKE